MFEDADSFISVKAVTCVAARILFSENIGSSFTFACTLAVIDSNAAATNSFLVCIIRVCLFTILVFCEVAHIVSAMLRCRLSYAKIMQTERNKACFNC